MFYSSNMLHTEVENSVVVDKIQSKKVSRLEIKEKRKLQQEKITTAQPKCMGKDFEDLLSKEVNGKVAHDLGLSADTP